MTKFLTAFFALLIMVGTSNVSIAAEDTITCALSRAYDCFPDEGCKEWSIDEMALPRFVRIDLKAKTITSLDKEIPQNSKISSIERLEGLTVMHGTELRGWSISLGEESRNLTLSVAGDGEGFIVFGTCMDK
jgi:hypothetical protein